MRRVTHSSHSCGSLWINNADIAIIIMIVIFAFTLTHTSSVTPTSGSQRDPNQWITALSRTWFLRFCPCPRPCPCPCPCPAHFAVRENIFTRTLVLVLVRSSICFSRRLDPYMFSAFQLHHHHLHHPHPSSSSFVIAFCQVDLCMRIVWTLRSSAIHMVDGL